MLDFSLLNISMVLLILLIIIVVKKVFFDVNVIPEPLYDVGQCVTFMEGCKKEVGVIVESQVRISEYFSLGRYIKDSKDNKTDVNTSVWYKIDIKHKEFDPSIHCPSLYNLGIPGENDIGEGLGKYHCLWVPEICVGIDLEGTGDKEGD